MHPARPSPPSDLCRLSVAQLRAGFLARTFSPVEVFDALAERITAADPVVHAFWALALDEARVGAVAAEAAYVAERPRSLEGIPFAAKDLFDSEGLRTSYGSRMFATNIPARDAEMIRRLREAGALLVGKTATHEFAWGITSVNPGMGTPLNPWLRTRITGGSSGGSAAAVAALMVPFALATDTGGSVRIPSGFCGVVGLKPTFGAISAAGVFPLSPSLDHPGLMARDPADIADLLDVVATAATIAPRSAVTAGGRPTRVGICPDLVPVRPAAALTEALAGARELIAGLNTELVEVKFPEASLVGEAFSVTQRAEAYETHRRLGLFPSRAAEYGDDVRRHLESAADIDIAQYLHAQRDRATIRAGFRRLFEEVDILLGPANPIAPPGLDAVGAPFRSVVMPFMVPQDLAGLPAVVVRAGFDVDGLPISIQLTGPAGADHRVIALARAFHEATAELQSRWPALPPA